MYAPSSPKDPALGHQSTYQQPIFVNDDGIMYITQTDDSANAGNLSLLPFDDFKCEVEALRSEMANLKTEFHNMKQEFKETISNSIRQAVTDCFESNFIRLAAMMDMSKTIDEPVMQTGQIVEEHVPINDADNLTKFNILLANEDVRKQYIAYYTKIVIPDTYIGRGDSAFYIIADCLFTRAFWDTFTWTGINRGNKSKKGFREFANVLQLLLAIVRIGDPTYTLRNLETFCKTRLFRYSKARSISKQLRKSACRLNRKKKHDGNADIPIECELGAGATDDEVDEPAAETLENADDDASHADSSIEGNEREPNADDTREADDVDATTDSCDDDVPEVSTLFDSDDNASPDFAGFEEN
ncbi:uncharacterized protein LOC135711210 [Ochlerotatus camptorhynchus]|uniref:uncharacterized protein LOC135711210 n=1 Tax=Ochlerotatus camptorhynchus TaxID=644619 RepID=UPI0031E04303